VCVRMDCDKAKKEDDIINCMEGVKKPFPHLLTLLSVG